MSRHPRGLQLCARLLRTSSHTTPSPALTLLASHAGHSATIDGAYQTRLYAAPRAPRPVPRPAPKQTPTFAEAYTLDGITQEKFEAAINMTGFWKALPAEEYFAIAKRFEAAVKNGGNPYAVKLTGDKPVSATALYDVGCILFHVAGASARTLAYTSAMWASASDMGSRLATICIARQIVRSGAWGKKPNLRPAENSFRKLVAEGRDPNALTVQAELLWMAGNYTEAAKAAKKALDVGKGDFEWEPECRLCLAKAYVKLKRDAEAKELLDSLSEMSFAEAHEYLGYLLLSSDTDKAEQHFFHAGYYGRPGMYQQLSEIAVTNGSKAASEEERKEYSRWAMEWAHLANPKAAF